MTNLIFAVFRPETLSYLLHRFALYFVKFLKLLGIKKVIAGKIIKTTLEVLLL